MHQEMAASKGAIASAFGVLSKDIQEGLQDCDTTDPPKKKQLGLSVC